MDYIDRKYILSISSMLLLFSDAGNNVYNFRCPYCNDSKKSKHKTRGYLYYDGVLKKPIYKCHNCGVSVGLGHFIQKVAPGLYMEYKRERLGNRFQPKKAEQETINTEVFKTNTKFVNNTLANKLLSLCTPLTQECEGRDYCISRKLPMNKIESLYYIDDLNELIKRIPKYEDKTYRKAAAVVIPFINLEGVITHIQLRILNCGDWRYMTLELTEEKHNKIYGLNAINKDDTVYVFEGPFDSMFVNNAIANASGSLSSIIPLLNTMFRKYVLCFDIDYTSNPDILKYMEKSISMGANVLIYDRRVRTSGAKDINDIIKNNIVPDINKYLKENTYNGFKAKLALSQLSTLNKTINKSFNNALI